MRLYIDTDTRNFLLSATSPGVVKSISYKRRDTDLIELQFIRDGVVQELSGTTARFGLKPAGDYDAPFLSTGTFTKSGTGTSTRYLLDLNLNTTELAAAFTAADEPETLAAMAEVEWSSGTNVFSSVTLPVVISNDVIRGDEGAPASAPLFYISSNTDFRATQAQAQAATDNNTWMSPLRVDELVKANFLPVYSNHTFDSSNETTPYAVPAARYRRIIVTSYSPITQDLTMILPRSTDGAFYGDILRINFSRQGHTKRLLIRQYGPSYPTSYSTSLVTLATLSEDGMYSFHCSRDASILQWVTEESFTGLGRSNAPQLRTHTFSDQNQATAYTVTSGRNVRLHASSFTLTQAVSLILPRPEDGAVFGDIFRVKYSQTGHSQNLLVRRYQYNGVGYENTLLTLSTLSAAGTYGFCFDGQDWVTEAAFTGL